ncbi:MAG: GIY-YIG nuclease family protein [Chloroflexi bacterium]|nr:GIY-YIG nuclease family protein [Chloroflexota bacterium]
MTEFIKKVGREVKKAYGEAQREAQRQSQRPKPRPRTRPAPAAKICEFWSCQEEIREDHFLCRDHHSELQQDLINKCPSCGRYKDAQYETCLDCHAKPRPRTTRETNTRYRTRQDPDPSWEAGDAEATSFFTYVLKLDGGQFYVGQTRDLRARLMEHRQGTGADAPRGKHPKLQWFAVMSTRRQAMAKEKQLKELLKQNPREMRNLIIGFRDIYRELEFD